MVLETILVPLKNIRTEEELLKIIQVIEAIDELYDLNGIRCATIGRHELFRILQEYALFKERLPEYFIRLWRMYYNTPELVSRLQRIGKATYSLGALPLKYRHLIDHTDYNGYYIPISFLNEPIWFHDSPIGSSVHLRQELLLLKCEMDNDGIEATTELFMGWKRLFNVVEHSLNHALIIIFRG